MLAKPGLGATFRIIKKLSNILFIRSVHMDSGGDRNRLIDALCENVGDFRGGMNVLVTRNAYLGNITSDTSTIGFRSRNSDSHSPDVRRVTSHEHSTRPPAESLDHRELNPETAFPYRYAPCGAIPFRHFEVLSLTPIPRFHSVVLNSKLHEHFTNHVVDLVFRCRIITIERQHWRNDRAAQFCASEHVPQMNLP